MFDSKLALILLAGAVLVAGCLGAPTATPSPTPVPSEPISATPAPTQAAGGGTATPTASSPTATPTPVESSGASALDCGALLSAAEAEGKCGAPVTMEIDISEGAGYTCDRSFKAADARALSFHIDMYKPADVNKGAFDLTKNTVSQFPDYKDLTLGDGGREYTQDVGAGQNRVVGFIKGGYTVTVSTSKYRSVEFLCSFGQLEDVARTIAARMPA